MQSREYRAFFYVAYLPPAILVQLVLLEHDNRLVNKERDLVVGLSLKVVDRPHSFGHGSESRLSPLEAMAYVCVCRVRKKRRSNSYSSKQNKNNEKNKS